MVIDNESYEKNKKKKIKIDNQSLVGDKSSPTELKDIYGIIPSSSNFGSYYLITGKEDNLSCSCPARVECKHLKGIKDGKTTCLRISRPFQEEV